MRRMIQTLNAWIKKLIRSYEKFLKEIDIQAHILEE